MADPVFISIYDEPPFRMDEILRYAGVADARQEDILRLARECCDMVSGKLSFRVCWREFPVRFDAAGTDLGFARTGSADVRRRLQGCGRIVLFAATVGFEIDRLITRFSAVSPAKALMLQAVGAERIEALCDRFSEDVAGRAAARGERTRLRFSPGYGDLPIEMQRDIFRVLECPAKIGLTLNESLLMSPSKSVTAMIGIGKDDPSCPPDSGGCDACRKTDCPYRKARPHEDP